MDSYAAGNEPNAKKEMRGLEMQRYLFIIITRMYVTKGSDDDEFVIDWGQPNEKEHVLISGHKLDILLLHGYSGRFTKNEDIKKAIEASIDDTKLNASVYGKIYILYHPQSGGTINEEFLKTILPNLSKVEKYGSQTGGVIGRILSFSDLSSDAKREAKSIFPRLRVTRFSLLKHRLAHIFLPIDIDLQGLIETGFDEKHWKEIVATWKPEQGSTHSKAYQTLEEARKILYNASGEPETIEWIVERAKENGLNKQKIETEWAKIQKLLPKHYRDFQEKYGYIMT